MRQWKHTVYVGAPFHSDLPFKQRRDMIVTILKGLPMYDDIDGDLYWIVDELSDTDHEDEFDTVWDGLYDWADDNDVWIDTFTIPPFGLGVDHE